MSFARFCGCLIIGLIGICCLIGAFLLDDFVLIALIVLADVIIILCFNKWVDQEHRKKQQQRAQGLQQADQSTEPPSEPEIPETALESATPKPTPNYYAAYSSGIHKVIALDHIYLIEGKRKCWQCEKETPVIAFGLEQYVDLEGDVYFHDNIMVAKSIQPLPEKLESYLRDHYRYYRHVNRKNGECEYPNNHCIHCNCVQGDFYLHDEIYNNRNGDGLFFDLKVSGSALTYYSVKLPCNMQLSCDLNIYLPLALEPFVPSENLIIEGRFSWE